MKQNITIEDAAKIIYAANIAYCYAIGDVIPMPWESLSEERKIGYYAGIRNALSNPNNSPEANHENWMATRQHEGWVWGPVKDELKKMHPLLIPYDKLPLIQRTKDMLFINIVKALSVSIKD